MCSCGACGVWCGMCVYVGSVVQTECELCVEHVCGMWYLCGMYGVCGVYGTWYMVSAISGCGVRVGYVCVVCGVVLCVARVACMCYVWCGRAVTQTQQPSSPPLCSLEETSVLGSGHTHGSLWTGAGGAPAFRKRLALHEKRPGELGCRNEAHRQQEGQRTVRAGFG